MGHRKQYIYKKEDVLGEIREWEILNIEPSSHRVTFNNLQPTLYTSPYVPFVPLLYLNIMPFNIANWYHPDSVTCFPAIFSSKDDNRERIDRANSILSSRVAFSKILSHAYHIDSPRCHKQLIYYINKWLENDVPLDLSKLMDGIMGLRESIIESFHNRRQASKFCQRSYKGASALFSLFLRREADNPFVPHILAVTLPENIIPIKLHILEKGTIPLDKVIILVDKNLDSPQFAPTAFRTLYKELYKSTISKTACDVWKVPLEFIQENCFINPPSQVTGESIRDKKKSKEDLIKKFYEFINSGKYTLIENNDLEGIMSPRLAHYGIPPSITSTLVIDGNGGMGWSLPSANNYPVIVEEVDTRTDVEW